MEIIAIKAVNKIFYMEAEKVHRTHPDMMALRSVPGLRNGGIITMGRSVIDAFYKDVKKSICKWLSRWPMPTGSRFQE